jgi:low affinity Fe/Cu permease
MGRFDERFTDFCDRLTEYLGDWRVGAVSVLVILCWGAAGPAMHFSDTWQLLINTPTTIAEFVFNFFILASNNRQVRNDRRLQAEVIELVKQVRVLASQIKTEEDEILEISRESRAERKA